MPTAREAIKQREQGRAAVRALYLAELQDIGKTRSRALKVAEDQLERVAQLLTNALDAGLTLAEIARLSDVSRPTLYQLRGRYSEDLRDRVLAVIQTIANAGVTRRHLIERQLKWSADAVNEVMDGLIESGWVVEDFNEDSADPAMEIFLTEEGFNALDAWTFERDEGEDW